MFVFVLNAPAPPASSLSSRNGRGDGGGAAGGVRFEGTAVGRGAGGVRFNGTAVGRKFEKVVLSLAIICIIRHSVAIVFEIHSIQPILS